MTVWEMLKRWKRIDQLMLALFLGLAIGNLIRQRWELGAWQMSTTLWAFMAINTKLDYQELSDLWKKVHNG